MALRDRIQELQQFKFDQLDPNNIGAWPAPIRGLVLALVALIVLALGFVFVVSEKRKELGTIFPKLESLLGQIAQREGLTMVFDRSSSGLAWAPSSLDLTNELIRMYNNQFKAAAPVKKDGLAPKPVLAPAPVPAPTK